MNLGEITGLLGLGVAGVLLSIFLWKAARDGIGSFIGDLTSKLEGN